MITNALIPKEVNAIPKRAEREWNYYTADISNNEWTDIISWINDRFDEVLTKRVRVQPSGWLGSGFDWNNSPLMPIYRECCNRLLNATDEEKEEKSGQIFGLFVSLTLSEHRSENWYFVKGEGYEAHGVPIRSRIYFLPEFETT